MKSQYKNLKFDSNSEFTTWLDENAYYIIWIKNNENFKKIFVDKNGGVLHVQKKEVIEKIHLNEKKEIIKLFIQNNIWQEIVLNIQKIKNNEFVQVLDKKTNNWEVSDLQIDIVFLNINNKNVSEDTKAQSLNRFSDYLNMKNM